MKGKQLVFYASETDIRMALEAVASASLQFVPINLTDPEGRIEILNASELKPRSAYLVQKTGTPVTTRRIDQYDGKVRFVAEPEAGSSSAVVRTGGMIKDRLLPGDVSTMLGDEGSLAIFATLSKSIRKHFEKVKSYHVGPEAAAMLDRGGRLSPTEKSPPEYDLVR